MPLWKIAWRSIQRRGLASSLTALSMALGVMLVVGVLVIHGIVSESFRNNSTLGYNVIMGANKGGKLQIVLNTVFYLSQPAENVPYSFYQHFLDAKTRGDGVDGQWHEYVMRVVPVCLGDYYKKYRVVGTLPSMFERIDPEDESERIYTFSSGRNFQVWNDDHGYFEAVLGSRVAQDYGLKVGDTIVPTHGSADGEAHDEFFIVGILAPSGTPNDRAVFVNMEGFFLLDGHALPDNTKDQQDANSRSDSASGDGESEIGDGESEIGDTPPTSPELEPRPTGTDSAALTRETQFETRLAAQVVAGQKTLPNYRLKTTPLPVEQREVTALLVRTVNPFVTMGLSNSINEGTEAQAVMPIREISALFESIVRPIQTALLVMTALICVVSGISILVSIYNSMSDRHREIAIMRSLGASRRNVMAVVLLEAVMLALGGGLLGWIGAHLAIKAASPYVEQQTGVQLGLLDFAPPVPVFRYSEPIINLERWMGDIGKRILDVAFSPEVLLVPTIIILAILVGFLPALTAYKTDVAKSLSAHP